MGAGRNKVLLELGGKPILRHSVDTFRRCCGRLIVVSAAEDLSAIRALFPDLKVVEGGATRHGSEWNALQALDSARGVVAVHDGARPLVAAADVEAVFAAAEQHGASMLAEPASLPGLFLKGDRVARAYPPQQLWRALTPQAAHADLLLDAYRRAAEEGFEGTDTSAVLERAGVSVRIVPATVPNPKITVAADLAAAKRLL
ncbi:MAG: 2-C-methyl-D-erythritol 4-phosphate cytidylyltransferase [Chloroflexi bacterium]|nr:2-C-methyl-D-erythritol 4-phosphate cytidylyltransferase [Chloroflexota bacterium]